MLDSQGSAIGTLPRTGVRSWRPWVCVVVLLQATACAGQSPSPEAPLAVPRCAALPAEAGVRFDGLYQASPGRLESYWYYLRFYADGTVLSASSTGTPAQVANWLTKAKADAGSGCATVDSRKIRFGDTSSAGTVDYSGTVENDSLALHSVSHINGHVADEVFRFVPVQLPDR
jgi:hypothetical protein